MPRFAKKQQVDKGKVINETELNVCCLLRKVTSGDRTGIEVPQRILRTPRLVAETRVIVYRLWRFSAGTYVVVGIGVIIVMKFL